jgi:hypothetical protein
MPRVEVIEEYPFPRDVVFGFFADPARALAAAPPDSGLRLVSILPDGRYEVEARRWGLTRRIVMRQVEVRPFDLLVEEQEKGPLATWRVERWLRGLPGGTEVRETAEFEPPGGLLGLTLTAARVEAELRAGYEGRVARVTALLGGPA